MNSTAVFTLSRSLMEAVLSGDEKAAAIIAADLKAAFAEEQTFAPWTPHNQRSAS